MCSQQGTGARRRSPRKGVAGSRSRGGGWTMDAVCLLRRLAPSAPSVPDAWGLLGSVSICPKNAQEDGKTRRSFVFLPVFPSSCARGASHHRRSARSLEHFSGGSSTACRPAAPTVPRPAGSGSVDATWDPLPPGRGRRRASRCSSGPAGSRTSLTRSGMTFMDRGRSTRPWQSGPARRRSTIRQRGSRATITLSRETSWGT